MPIEFTESLIGHDALGVTALVIRGFDPVEYRPEMISLVRREVARRDRAAA